jgi:putative endonuclease
MFSVYVLYSKVFKKTYVGFSGNVIERLAQHNAGRVISSKKYRPWEIIFEEKSESELIARRREKYYKSAAGRRKLKKIFDDLGLNKVL